MRPSRWPFCPAVLTWFCSATTETLQEHDCDNGEAYFFKRDPGPSGCPVDPESVGANALVRTVEEMGVPDICLHTADPRHHRLLEPYWLPHPGFVEHAEKRIAGEV